MSIFRRKNKRKRKGGDGGDCCIADAAFDSCYVATAAHGDADAPEVVTLRQFRDQELMTTPRGRQFSHFYYRYGRYPAAVIQTFPFLKPPARAIIRPAVWWAKRKLR